MKIIRLDRPNLPKNENGYRPYTMTGTPNDDNIIGYLTNMRKVLPELVYVYQDHAGITISVPEE